MKLMTNAKLTVLAVDKKEASGDYGESYKMAVMQGSEVATLSCSREAYETAVTVPLMKSYDLTMQLSEYQGRYNIRVIAFTTVPSK